MTKTANRPITVSDEKHDEVTIQPGEKVPSWAEPYVKPEYLAEDHPVAAGTDLFEDHTYPQMVKAAENIGIEVDPSWSSEQIQAIIRAKLFDDDVEDRFEEDEIEENAVDAMTALFGESNKAGNVNAPDTGEDKLDTKTETKTKATSGGADS